MFQTNNNSWKWTKKVLKKCSRPITIAKSEKKNLNKCSKQITIVRSAKTIITIIIIKLNEVLDFYMLLNCDHYPHNENILLSSYSLSRIWSLFFLVFQMGRFTWGGRIGSSFELYRLEICYTLPIGQISLLYNKIELETW